MSAIAMSGSDTVNINGRILADFADGDFANLDFPNDSVVAKRGKNGNTIYSLNETGALADFVLRLIRGSADDKFLNNLMANQFNNFAGFILMTGEFIKRIGDGAGNISNDTYINSGGVFTKRIPAKGNAEGDTEQNVAVFHIKFSNNPRIIA